VLAAHVLGEPVGDRGPPVFGCERELERDRRAALRGDGLLAPPREGLGAHAVGDRRLLVGALLVADEIKTVGRLAIGGGCERFDERPDLVVMGKAIANGFPLAAVGGRADLMAGVTRTWISSTLATEFVSLAAARATLATLQARRVPEQLGRIGAWLLDGFRGLVDRFPRHLRGVGGVPEMCCLLFHDEATGARLAVEAARRGVLFKRSPYNFVSMAHGEREIERAIGVLGEALENFRLPLTAYRV
jgi:glutamate-1-semialdehyde 2,1-aminomutase